MPLLLVSLAHAGGIGVITTGGFHQENLYSYDAELNQYKLNQMRPSVGVGMQGVLGDRDDAFVGIFKFQYIGDFAPTTEGWKADAKAQCEELGGECDTLTAPVAREGMRPIGIATAGLQWGVWGDPTGFQVNVITNVGAGFMTLDSTEFLLVELGGGAHYALSKELQVNAELTYDARYRKQLYHSAQLNLGVRYLFD